MFSEKLLGQDPTSMTGTENDTASPPPRLVEKIRQAWATYSQRHWLRCLLLVLFGAGVHIPALPGQLVWDDLYLARDNPFIKSPLFVLEAFRHYLFPDSYAGHYRPVQNISYIFDYLIWNTETYGYHLSNVLWHLGSGILLYFLLRELFSSLGTRWLVKNNDAVTPALAARLSTTAFFFALLWVVHPVHSAAVDYISGRADSLAFFFACAGWLLYLRARKDLKPWLRGTLYVTATLSGLLALCSRESGFMWMLVFLLYAFCFDTKLVLKTKLIVLGVCLMVAATYTGLRQLPESRPAIVAHSSTGAAPRVVLMLRALGDYGRLMVFPSNLHMERSVSEPASLVNRDTWRSSIRLEYLSLAGAAVIAVFAFGAFRKGVGRNARIFGASW
ncbi:MAG: protein O-mannosyl-transferase, partial [Verrucomicrobiota bacterium]